MTVTPDELRERAETDMLTIQPTPTTCGQPHHNYPETLCTELAGHYIRDRDPHAGPLVVAGREIGGAAWDEPKDRR
jgi:hypothetical protein